jgi:hypothetical protein
MKAQVARRKKGAGAKDAGVRVLTPESVARLLGKTTNNGEVLCA